MVSLSTETKISHICIHIVLHLLGYQGYLTIVSPRAWFLLFYGSNSCCAHLVHHTQGINYSSLLKYVLSLSLHVFEVYYNHIMVNGQYVGLL